MHLEQGAVVALSNGVGPVIGGVIASQGAESWSVSQLCCVISTAYQKS